MRFRNLPNWVWYLNGYDDSRDMLVGRHIAQYGESVPRGSMADGSLNLIANSPVYYYTVALFYIFGRSPTGVMVLWAAVSAVMVYIGFLVGKNIRDDATGLCVALVIAIQPEFVYMGKVFEQTPFLPLFILLSLYILTSATRFTMTRFVVVTTLIFLPIHFHFGYIILFPVLLVWAGSLWWFDNTRTKLVFHVLTVCWIALQSMILLALTYEHRVLDQILFMQTFLQRHIPDFFGTIFSSIGLIRAMLFPGLPPAVSAMLMGISVAAVFASFRSVLRTRARIGHAGLFAALVLPVLFVGFYNWTIYPNYLYSVLTAYIIALGITMRQLFDVNRFVALCVLLVVIVYFSQLAIIRSNAPVSVSYYDQQRDVAAAIYRDFTKTERIGPRPQKPVFPLPAFTLATLSSTPYLWYDGWATGATWYFLEDYFGYRLVGLTKTESNFYPLVRHPKYFYVICDHRENARAEDVCFRRFTSARTYLARSYDTIYTSPTYTVWRFQILMDQPVDTYTIGYHDLMRTR